MISFYWYNIASCFCTIIKFCANFFTDFFYFLWQYDTFKLLFQNEQQSLNFKWRLYSWTLSSIKEKNHIGLNCNLNFKTMTTTFQRNSWIKHFHKISHPSMTFITFTAVLVLKQLALLKASFNKHRCLHSHFSGKNLVTENKTKWHWNQFCIRNPPLSITYYMMRTGMNYQMFRSNWNSVVMYRFAISACILCVETHFVV